MTRIPYAPGEVELWGAVAASIDIARLDHIASSSRLNLQVEGVQVNEKVKVLLQELGDAINETVTGSQKIEGIMQSIRDSGYEVYLLLQANIAVEDLQGKPEAESREEEEKFTSEDLKFLKRLKIVS
jgi:hypothetical protein